MTREQFESALDAGLLFTKVLSRGVHWYRTRRNGRTKTWKRDSTRFEIPIKYRFRDTMRVKSLYFDQHMIDEWFTIVPYPGCKQPGECQGYCRRDPNCGD